MKVALVHDYLGEFGGAERVLLALSEIWPDAPIYTAFYRKGTAYERFKNKKIITSWAQKVPFFATKLHSPLRFFAPWIWGSFSKRLEDYDVIISSASWYVTKGLLRRKTLNVKRNTIEICYCHTPPRYLYGYPTSVEWRKYWPVRMYALLVNHFMRVYDYEAAQRVNWFIANSKEVQARIKKFYRRDSTVIYPPVWVHPRGVQGNIRAHPGGEIRERVYFLVVSRLVASKNVDLAVKVCVKLSLPLKVVGTGRQLEYLKKLATVAHSRSVPGSTNAHSGSESRSSIELLGDVSDDELVQLYENCLAVIFPASQEDFGLVPVEAMAAGKPVIALAEGGVLETVVDGKTGILFDEPTLASLESAIKKFEKHGKWDTRAIKRHAEKFGKSRFQTEIKKFMAQAVRG